MCPLCPAGRVTGCLVLLRWALEGFPVLQAHTPKLLTHGLHGLGPCLSLHWHRGPPGRPCPCPAPTPAPMCGSRPVVPQGYPGRPCVGPFLRGIPISHSVHGSRQWEGVSTGHQGDWRDRVAGASNAPRGLPSQTWPWLRASHMAVREGGFFLRVPGVCWATIYLVEKWRQMLGKAGGAQSHSGEASRVAGTLPPTPCVALGLSILICTIRFG